MMVNIDFCQCEVVNIKLTPVKHELKKKHLLLDTSTLIVFNSPKVEGDGERDLFPDLDIDDRGLLFGSTASCKWERKKQCTTS